MKARTIPRTCFLHTGQSFIAAAQSVHETKWPQGRNTTATSLSMHILHTVC